jgi:hypothetical protein
MCLPLQDGQTPRPLHENAMTNPWPQPVQRARPNIATVVGMGLHEFAPVSGRTARGRGKNEGTNLRIHAD